MADTISPLTRNVFAGLAQILDGAETPDRLYSALRHLAKWRSVLLENTLVVRSGDRVLTGPFAGMHYGVRASEGSRTARLLGCYEASLAPVFETVIARAPPLVIDVGAAEGYYAVGLARRMAHTQVYACDSDASARERCLSLAKANGVAHRLQIGGEVSHADFDICSGRKSFVLCDIEGAEAELLDPMLAPGLCHADILVEVHEGKNPGLLATLRDRFAPTHNITRIDRRLTPEALPEWAETLGDLDRLLLLWEWRAAPTPWLWMQRK